MTISDVKLSQWVQGYKHNDNEIVGLLEFYALITGNEISIDKLYEVPQFYINGVIDIYLLGNFELFGSNYSIKSPLPETDKLNEEQFKVVQEISLVFADLLDGNNGAMYELCAVYLQKEGEGYNVSKEKIELMKDLPLDIAMCVKKFVEDSIKFYNDHSEYFTGSK